MYEEMIINIASSAAIALGRWSLPISYRVRPDNMNLGGKEMEKHSISMQGSYVLQQRRKEI